MAALGQAVKKRQRDVTSYMHSLVVYNFMYLLFKVPRNRSLLVTVNEMWLRGGERGEMARL